MRDVTDADFEQAVLGAAGPVVVDFWAPWCGPCVRVTQVLEGLASEQGGVEFVRLDIDANPRTAARAGIMSIPTAILFEAGEARSEVIGPYPRSHYEKVWAGWFA
ncbi:MAG TPA: thioredoxin domain-containing protein [Gaiellaceae bacterium]|nr:thioredoxin domain-containing protein [Gaiellaceae bacterium]